MSEITGLTNQQVLERRQQGQGNEVELSTSRTYKDIVLTSVLKNMDVAIYDTIKMASASGFGSFGGELYVGTLENGGVGIAKVNGGAVSDSDIDAVKQAVIKGEADTGWGAYISSLN